jgi:hypothetical protein
MSTNSFLGVIRLRGSNISETSQPPAVLVGSRRFLRLLPTWTARLNRLAALAELGELAERRPRQSYSLRSALDPSGGVAHRRQRQLGVTP